MDQPDNQIHEPENQKHLTHLEKPLNYLRDSASLHQSRNLTDFGRSMDISHMKSSAWSLARDHRKKFEMTHMIDSNSNKTWKKKAFEPRSILGARVSNTPEGFSSDTHKIGNLGASEMLMRSTGSELRFVDEAVQLIRVSKEGQFEVTMEGLSLLRSFEGPIAVLGVAGKFRTGKSYLLNRIILQTDSGFGVAPTINACTKGIWMYGKPIPVTLKDGTIGNLLVLDSEGLDAIDQDASHDCRILALMMLLTSMFVYNSVGAIDENAISSLSLVINLTKHIKVRAKNRNQAQNSDDDDESDDDEEDPEELAKFFPNFLWVLRDFSLELIDENGREISPKQYLENALALHKGISDKVQEKNRLRRLICQFFPDRNCYPLVRPLLDEDDLQRLNELPIQRLRPEFVEASQRLRQLLFTQAKPKTLKNKKINGNCLAGLIVQYTRAINSGAVPNIESAWTYVCSNQRENLKKELTTEFWETLTEQMETSGALNPTEMQDRLRDLVKSFKKRLKDQALDGLSKLEIKEFKERLSELGARVESENLALLQSQLLEVLEEKFRREVDNPIESFEREKRTERRAERERNPDSDEWVQREGKSWDTVLKKIVSFKNGVSDMGLDGLEQQIVANQFIFDKLQTNATKTYNSLCKATEMLKLSKNSKISLLNEKTQNQQKTLTELRSQISKRERDLQEKIETAESERDLARRQIELKAQEARKNLKERESDLNQQITRLTKKIDTLQTESASLKENCEAMREDHRQKEAERETEVVLLQQKVAFLENEKEEWGRRKRQFEEERRHDEEKRRKEIELARKGAEESVRAMKGEMKKLETTMMEMREEATQQSFIQDNMCAQWTNKEDEIRQKLEETIQQRELLTQALETERDKHQDWERQLDDLKTEIHKETTEKNLWKTRAQEIEEKFKQRAQGVGKEQQIENQKLKFMEEERDRAREELQKAKLINKELIELMDMEEKETEKPQSPQVNQLEAQLEELRSRVKEECRLKETAEKGLRENETRSNAEKERLKKEMNSIKEVLNRERSERESEQTRHAKIQQEIENQKEKIISEMRNMYTEKISALENEIENARTTENSKIQEVKTFHIQREREMREFFGEEKERLERKIKKERESWKLRLEELEEESEQRLAQERREREEESEAWESRVRDAEEMGREWRERAENERVERERELLRQLETAKEEVVQLKSQAEAANEESKRWANEREVWRVEKEEEFKGIKEELIGYKKQAQELGLQLQHAEESKTRTEKRLHELEKRWDSERNENSQAREEWKKERTEMVEEVLSLKMKLTQEVAIAQQKIEFKDSKILELEQRVNSLNLEAETRRTELEKRLQSQQEEVTLNHEKEITEWQQRTDTLRSDFKNLQSQLNEKKVEAEKAQISLRDKLAEWENERKQTEKKNSKEIKRLKSDVARLKDKIKENTESHSQEIEHLKNSKYQAEIAYSESVAILDKETSLWKGRENFLIEQRTQAQNELKELDKSFKTVLKKLQEYRKKEKSTLGSNELERKLDEAQREYQVNLQKAEAISRERESALIERIEALEAELNRAEQERQNRMATKFGQRLEEEKKLNQLLEREKAQQDTIMMLRCQKDQVILQAQRHLEQEKERLKKIIFKHEAAFKTLENEKNMLFFEQEKQKTKWAIEKENLIYQKQEMGENVQKLRRQKEHLTKENERLKGNIKVLKKSNLGHSIMSFARSRYYPGKSGISGNANPGSGGKSTRISYSGAISKRIAESESGSESGNRFGDRGRK